MSLCESFCKLILVSRIEVKLALNWNQLMPVLLFYHEHLEVKYLSNVLYIYIYIYKYSNKILW